jgi:hypothetical protein
LQNVTAVHTSFPAVTETTVKSKNTSKKVAFSPEFIAAALAAAPEHVVYDPENPLMAPGEFDDAIVSHSYAELKEKLAQRRRHCSGSRRRVRPS